MELELFFENYDYDPDEGLELRPEFIEALEREDEYIKSGGKMWTLEEVAKELTDYNSKKMGIISTMPVTNIPI